ncbi:MAG: phosphopantothenoylcysteine decarboxylase, partial [Syntrophomonadaceae bacterium]|nr:phosphopantothenoylcysteine decarboxylase [Syntrophomonadaceae bacterium]
NPMKIEQRIGRVDRIGQQREVLVYNLILADTVENRVKAVLEEKLSVILKELGKNKTANQILVGFAAETNDLIENAKKKLKSKNLDFIVANDVTQEGAGFATDTNIVTLIDRDGTTKSLPLMSKEDVATAIIDKVVELF